MALDGLEATGTAIIDPLYTLWLSFKAILPGLIAAIIVLIIGYFIALIIGHGVRLLLERIGIDAKLRKSRLSKTFGHTHVPNLAGTIIKWYIFVVFLQVAVDLLSLGTLSLLLDRFVRWIPDVLASIIIFIVGIAVAHFLDMYVSEHSKMRGAGLAGSLLKMTVLIITAIVALRQLGIEVSLLENLVIIFVGAMAIGLAIALGISLGTSLKADGAKWLDDFKKKHF